MNTINAQGGAGENALLAFHQTVKMEALERLASHMAHDFNNLVAIIVNNLESVIEDDVDKRHLRRLILAQRGAERAALLVQNLQKVWSRRTLNRASVQISKLVDIFLAGYEPICDKSIRIERKLAFPLPTVSLDPAQFQDTLSALASNACEAMPNGGSVVVETGEDFLDDSRGDSMATDFLGPCVFVRISDIGFGMSPDVTVRAFEPFFTTKEGSDGLGLTRVYSFVKQSAAHIQIESAEGKGTTVTLFFPALPEHET